MSKGPFLLAALVCESITVESGEPPRVTLNGLYDDRSIGVNRRPTAREPAIRSLVLFLKLAAGGATGSVPFEIVHTSPAGKTWRLLGGEAHFDGPDTVHTSNLALKLDLSESGAHALGVRLGGALLTRVPLRVEVVQAH